MNYLRAIDSLRKGSSYTAMSEKYEDIIWQSSNTTIPTKKECEDELKRLEEEDKKTQYRRDRIYPPIGDQLDALYHAGVFPTEMADKLKAVKEAHPKPE